jgi:site-specific recombinase XerD
MGQQEIEAYLNHLAYRRSVSASTQRGALNAIAFLYRAVLKTDMPCLQNLSRIKRHRTIPVVMSVREVQATVTRMTETTRLMAELIYGTGMRIGECVNLRVKDIDFDHRSITVRAGKGNKDRTTLQSLLGHRNVETTMIYTHIQPDYRNVSSPLDRMREDL